MSNHLAKLPGAVANASPDESAIPAISVDAISKTFGAIAALSNVSMAVAKGEIHAICGENGAGKSTLVKILTGVYEPDSGTIHVDGKTQILRNPRDAETLGISFVAQELSLCPHLSVEDNIWLGSAKVPFFHKRKTFRDRARAALDLLGAQQILLDQTVSELGMGQRQLVEIARMMTRDARVLILDEPTATLSDTEIERIFLALQTLKNEGRSIIYITHRLGEVFDICDTVTILRNGQHIETRSTAELDRKTLIEKMLGRSFVEMYPPSNKSGEDFGLVVEGLCIPGVVSDFHLSVPKGTIACIAGQVGSGAADVVNALAGLTYNASGRVTVNGIEVTLGSAESAAASNIMFISGDRAAEGIFQRLNVFDNLVATRLPDHSVLGVLRTGSLAKVARELANRVGVDNRRLRSFASELSGGNQQKLAFGRCIGNRKGGLLVMNEPTRGIDVGARAEIYQMMREFCAQGYTLVMTSSDLEEIAGLADTAITMYRGRQVGVYSREQLTMHQLVSDVIHPVAAAA